MKLSQSVKPISYLKAHTADIIKSFESGEIDTIVVTQNGEAKAILLDIKEYEQIQESLKLLKILMQSRESLQKGKHESLAKTFADIRKQIKS